MGNCHIPTQIKDIALELWTLGWDPSDICRIFHISPRSLYCYHPCIVSLAILDAIHVLLKSHPDTYLDELQWFLAIHHDLPISLSALQHNLIRAGLRHSLITAMSIDGYIVTQIQPGSFDSFGFFDFIIEDILPLMNLYPEKQSILVMDNCRIHHTETLIDILNASHNIFGKLI
ncbi:hypothetical protein F5146DRAFT_1104984 [Armillaria mellea]|nr:hypothetical protein F5146DRAFT_1104984 [Armillaria mellea]